MRSMIMSALLLLVLPALAHWESIAIPWLSMPAASSMFPQSATSTPNPQDKREVNSNIESNLGQSLSGDLMLDGADVEAHVDDVAITLSGTVKSEGQRRRALQLASPYAQYRKIIDKIEIK